MPVIPHVAVIGCLNADIVTFTGETLIVKSRAISAGSKGANWTVACGRASHHLFMSSIAGTGLERQAVLLCSKPTKNFLSYYLMTIVM